MKFSIFTAAFTLGSVLQKMTHAQPAYIPFTETSVYENINKQLDDYFDRAKFEAIQEQLTKYNKLSSVYAIPGQLLYSEDSFIDKSERDSAINFIEQQAEARAKTKQRAKYLNAALQRRHAILVYNLGEFDLHNAPTEAGFRALTYQFESDFPDVFSHAMTMQDYYNALKQQVKNKILPAAEGDKALTLSEQSKQQLSIQDKYRKKLESIKQKNIVGRDIAQQQSYLERASMLSLEMVLSKKWTVEEAMSFDFKLESALQKISESAAYQSYLGLESEESKAKKQRVLTTFKDIANLWILEAISLEMLQDLIKTFSNEILYRGFQENKYSLEDVYYYYPIFSNDVYLQSIVSGEKSLEEIVKNDKALFTESLSFQALMDGSAMILKPEALTLLEISDEEQVQPSRLQIR